jgi:hypothetical protein
MKDSVVDIIDNTVGAYDQNGVKFIPQRKYF